MCHIHNLNAAVPAATFTNAFTISVLLARVLQVIAVLGQDTHCVAVQLIATWSAVVVQSGAVVVLAVTAVAHVFTRLDWSSALGLLIYCVLYCRFSGI